MADGHLQPRRPVRGGAGVTHPPSKIGSCLSDGDRTSTWTTSPLRGSGPRCRRANRVGNGSEARLPTDTPSSTFACATVAGLQLLDIASRTSGNTASSLMGWCSTTCAETGGASIPHTLRLLTTEPTSCEAPDSRLAMHVRRIVRRVTLIARSTRTSTNVGCGIVEPAMRFDSARRG